MSKVWDGPTPYDTLRNALQRRAYSTAMNSPEVVAMYGALRNMATELDDDGIARWDALAAYEAWLREDTP